MRIALRWPRWFSDRLASDGALPDDRAKHRDEAEAMLHGAGVMITAARMLQTLRLDGAAYIGRGETKAGTRPTLYQNVYAVGGVAL